MSPISTRSALLETRCYLSVTRYYPQPSAMENQERAVQIESSQVEAYHAVEMMFSFLGWVSFSDETHSCIATVYFPAAWMQSQFRATSSTLGSPYLWKLTHPLPKTPVNHHHKNYLCLVPRLLS